LERRGSSALNLLDCLRSPRERGGYHIDLARIHDVFHVSMLRKCITNPDVIVEYEPLGIHEGLTYVEEPVEIVDKKEQVLCTKTIPIVKVLWHNHNVEEAS
jgi:hypothetical protein